MTDKPYLVIPTKRPDDLLIDIEGLSIGFAGANGGAPIVRNFDLTIRSRRMRGFGRRVRIGQEHHRAQSAESRLVTGPRSTLIAS